MNKVLLYKRGLTKLEAILIAIIIVVAIFGAYGWLAYRVPSTQQLTPTIMPQTTRKAVKNITIVDSAGRYVTVPWPLSRIVALTTQAAEVLIALRADNLIVGVTKYIEGKPELSRIANRTIVGTCFKPNIEAIISVKPEVVITYVKWPKPEALEDKLEPLGIKVIRLDFYKIDTLFAEVRLLGLLVNKTMEADEFVKFWEAPLTTIKERVKKLKPEQMMKVYFETYREYTAAGPGTGWDQDIKIAGGINIFADSPVPYPKVSPESVIERNPDVIIKAVSASVFRPYNATDTTPLKEIRESIMSRPGWDAINAVKAGRVYIISGALSSGPRSIIGIMYIAKWLYPKIFEDLDPETLHKEYLERFLGVPYGGIWAYP